MKKNVLIIDDDHDFVYLMERCLRKSEEVGRVDHCANGQEAMHYFNQIQTGNHPSNSEWPAITLLDINMPVMNGFEFLNEFEQLVTQPGSAPFTNKIYMISSSNSKTDTQRAEASSYIEKYIQKPIQCQALLDQVGLSSK